MNYTFRKAMNDDLPHIQALFAEMMQAIAPGDAGIGYKAEDVAYYFSGGEDWICLAESEGKVIGFLAMESHREDVNYIYLDDLSVSAACRGKGVGTALLNEADCYARELGFPYIVLHVKMTNAGAKRLYERYGFTVMDDDGDRYRMIKTL